jgi:hypothetical protein
MKDAKHRQGQNHANIRFVLTSFGGKGVLQDNS